MTWYQHGIIYQIYPRSFADSNGDGIGDINGIRARLDYLSELGVDALWLSPIYPSPDKDFGYDVAEYCDIDPKFGTLADFDCLVEEAHARGLRIILDLVLNHTSDQHAWFQESRSSRENPKRGWYIWADPAPGGGPPNNWQSAFGGSGWEWDSATGQYYFHMFVKEQPDVNWHHPEVRRAMLDVFRFWLERGVDGFRLDVFNAYFKCADLSSNPVRFPIPFYGFLTQEHVNDCSRPEMIPLLQEIRALLDGYSAPGHERYVVGETFHDGARQAAAYTGPDRLHAAFNFDFLHSPWWAGSFARQIQRWEHMVGDNWPSYVLNNHDQVRSATRFQSLHLREFNLPLPSRRPEDDARLKVAAAMLLTLRGTPFLYYGEEIGMRNIPIQRSDILDPVGRRFWPVFPGRDGCRSPMQWDASANAGFSSAGARTWLPVHVDFPQRNVANQAIDPRSLLNFYRSLIAVRRAAPALTEGMYQPVTFGTRFLMAYLRQTRDQTVLVALNFSRRKQRLVLGGHLARAEKKLLLSTHRETLPPMRNNLLPLEPYEAILIEIGL
jgi:alpha-glucosidase